MIPFPQRRLHAVRREQESRQLTGSLNHDADEDSILSDESWPTDQDDAIATLRVRVKKDNKPQRKVARKPGPKATRKKAAKPKKTTKKEIDNMISTLQCPLPRDTLTFNNELGRKEKETIIRKQSARLRSLTARILKKQKQTMMQLGQQAPAKDALAIAIDMANIVDQEQPLEEGATMASETDAGNTREQLEDDVMNLFEDSEVAKLCTSPNELYARADETLCTHTLC